MLDSHSPSVEVSFMNAATTAEYESGIFSLDTKYIIEYILRRHIARTKSSEAFPGEQNGRSGENTYE